MRRKCPEELARVWWPGKLARRKGPKACSEGRAEECTEGWFEATLALDVEEEHLAGMWRWWRWVDG